MKFNGILFSICSVFVFDHIPAKIIDISISLSCSLTNISILACWDEMSAVLFSLEQVADNILWIIKKMFVTFTCSCNLIAIKLNIAACIAMFWKKRKKDCGIFFTSTITQNLTSEHAEIVIREMFADSTHKNRKTGNLMGTVNYPLQCSWLALHVCV